MAQISNSVIIEKDDKLINDSNLTLNDTKLTLNDSNITIKIDDANVLVKLHIGSSKFNTRSIKLPDKLTYEKYNISLGKNQYLDTFNFNVKDNELIIKRTDKNTGWGANHYVIFSNIKK
jgi:hypothetical protein